MAFKLRGNDIRTFPQKALRLMGTKVEEYRALPRPLPTPARVDKRKRERKRTDTRPTFKARLFDQKPKRHGPLRGPSDFQDVGGSGLSWMEATPPHSNSDCTADDVSKAVCNALKEHGDFHGSVVQRSEKLVPSILWQLPCKSATSIID